MENIDLSKSDTQVESSEISESVVNVETSQTTETVLESTSGNIGESNSAITPPLGVPPASTPDAQPAAIKSILPKKPKTVVPPQGSLAPPLRKDAKKTEEGVSSDKTTIPKVGSTSTSKPQIKPKVPASKSALDSTPIIRTGSPEILDANVTTNKPQIKTKAPSGKVISSQPTLDSVIVDDITDSKVPSKIKPTIKTVVKTIKKIDEYHVGIIQECMTDFEYIVGLYTSEKDALDACNVIVEKKLGISYEDHMFEVEENDDVQLYNIYVRKFIVNDLTADKLKDYTEEKIDEVVFSVVIDEFEFA